MAEGDSAHIAQDIQDNINNETGNVTQRGLSPKYLPVLPHHHQLMIITQPDL